MDVKRFLIGIIGIVGGLALSFLFIGRPVFAMEEAPVPTLYGASETEQVPQMASQSFSFQSSEEDPCLEKLYTCPVNTPTILQPQEQQAYSDGKAVFTGLSWNETKLDVYIDGVRAGRADLRTDPSNVGNFVFRPTVELAPGQHYMYVIAWNLSEWERSSKTPTVFFTISESKPVQQTPQAPVQEQPSPVEPDAEEATTTVSTPSAGNILDWFFNKQATTTATTTADRVRSGATASMIAIVVVILLGFFVHRRNQKKNGTPGTSDIPPDQHVPSDDGSPPSGTI